MTDEEDLLDILDGSASEPDPTNEIIKHNAGIIPPLPKEVRVTFVELEHNSPLETVRKADLQINNVQMFSLLHGLQSVRTIESLCKVNEQISKTLRYRRDLLGLEKEKDVKVPGVDHPLIPID
jgi:hypothetical protein